MPTFSSLAINDLDSFIFGSCPHPITLNNGLVIGGGDVYPELNFTLPNMIVNKDTMPEVRLQYTQMITDACNRAVELNATGLVIEFELLPDLTLNPHWGAEVSQILRNCLDKTQSAHSLKTALRVTPNDIREFARPPILRSGELVDKMNLCFGLCA
jgi:methanol---5-hydroxybenzimidazolylcobamide Co-methyltransferase